MHITSRVSASALSCIACAFSPFPYIDDDIVADILCWCNVTDYFPDVFLEFLTR